MFQRRHYEEIADLLKPHNTPADDSTNTHLAGEIAELTANDITLRFAEMFAADNERFNQAKFLERAGCPQEDQS